MKLPSGLQAVADALRGDQFKPTVILLVAPALALSWKYFGSPEFYLQHLSSGLPVGNDLQTAAAVYSFIACFLLMALVPALIVKLVFHERLSDYGIQLGNGARTLKSFLLLAPVFVLAAYIGSGDPATLQEYPINRNAGGSPATFVLHACTYFVFYMGWEFHFRGFLQFGLRGTLGDANALLIQVMASSLFHIDKPCLETFGAILAGILWGIIAYRSRSLLAGLLQHSLLGISLDWIICYRG